MKTSLLMAGILAVGITAAAQSRELSSFPVAALVGKTPREVRASLDELRPAPVSAEDKLLVLSSLPTKGRLTKLKPALEQKLASVKRVLQIHNRESQYELVVIDVPQAVVALHARTVVLISRNALAWLSAEELQACIAHEVGHEYVWNEYQIARERKDSPKLRELEIWCDAVAVLTLRSAQIDPSHLVTGLQKLWLYNLDRFGDSLVRDSYPSLADRAMLLKKLIEWTAN